MGAYGHHSSKPTVLFGSAQLACKRFILIVPACHDGLMMMHGACFPSRPRPYLSKFARKLNAKDKRRIAKNKAIKKLEMVKKTISKDGKVQVKLGFTFYVLSHRLELTIKITQTHQSHTI